MWRCCGQGGETERIFALAEFAAVAAVMGMLPTVTEYLEKVSAAKISVAQGE